MDIDVWSFSFRGHFTLWEGMSNTRCFQLNIVVYPFDQFKVELACNEASFSPHFFFCLATNFYRWQIICWQHEHFTLLNDICNLKVRRNGPLARSGNKRNTRSESDRNFRFLWPCIVSKVWREKNQQDSTIRFLLLTSISTCFGHYYTHLQENKEPVTAEINHNGYQPHPAEPEQYTICSNGFFVPLKMGIIMPETCWNRS